MIAHLWWWEFRYPGFSIVTCGDLHVPAGRPVSLTLRVGDDSRILAEPTPTHCFWVPALGALSYVIPGSRQHLVLRGNTPGEYEGRCLQFCGAGHANMRFRVFVDPPERFDAWMRHQEQTPVVPADDGEVGRGAQMFAGGLCTTCHAVAGVSKGSFGPNLTHFGSRSMIAGTLDNTSINLKRWIQNPGEVKPGAHMPILGLRGARLDEMVAYLESLK